MLLAFISSLKICCFKVNNFEQKMATTWYKVDKDNFVTQDCFLAIMQYIFMPLKSNALVNDVFFGQAIGG